MRIVVPAVVSVTGFLVALAWTFDLRHVLDVSGPSRMVSATAVAFIFAGAVLYGLLKDKPQRAFLAFCSLSLVGVLTASLFSSLLVEYQGPATVVIGLPSIGTLMAFHLIATCGVLRVLRENHTSTLAVLLGTVGLVGLIALVGWAFDAPSLYFYSPSRTNGMSPLTAALFLLYGATYVRYWRTQA